MLDSEAAVPHWRPASPAPRATLAFSTRRGGVSLPPFDTLNLGRSTADQPDAIEENRRRLLAGLGLDPAALATAGQVHGARIAEVVEPGLHPHCDALMTRSPGIALAITGADCLPIVLSAPGLVAAVHCGWRGLALEIATEAARATGVAAGLSAALGPCIRSCCYVVGPEVAAVFAGFTTTDASGAIRLDLPAVARAQLAAAGVDPGSVHDTRACTACAPDWYYSHRRDRGLTGRHWAVAALRP